MATYSVDIPDWINPEGEWKNVDEFESREAALKYVQQTFGADEEGRISIISTFNADDDANPDWIVIAQTEMKQALSAASFQETGVILGGERYLSFEELVTGLVGIADDIHEASETPEEFKVAEAESWASDALVYFEENLKKTGWLF